MFFAILLAIAAAVLAVPETVPQWPNNYYVRGTFSLPYANINQPTEMWYDGSNNRQLLSYYNGMDTYIWRYDIQTLYQVIPRVDTMSCFVTPGIGNGTLVTLLPNLTNWTYKGHSHVNGVKVKQFEQIVNNFNATAVYDMYVDLNNQPVQLHLLGYDFIFGSHPDEYVFDYEVYVPGAIDANAFNEPKICNSSAPASLRRTMRAKQLMGQLGAFIPDPQDITEPFEQFLHRHNKHYFSTEVDSRMQIFAENMKRIEDHNSGSQNSFKLGANHLMDLTHEEITSILMPEVPLEKKMAAGSNAMYTHQPSGKDLPPYVNWVETGAVNPPKDQGVCGSCWTFGTIGSLEGSWFLKTGNLFSLSEQQLVDCAWGAWGSGDSGCDGGFAQYALEYIISNGGIAYEDVYPYLMQDGWCKEVPMSGVTVKGYVNVTSGSEADLQDAVANFGPVAIAIDAAHPEFEFYTDGVYYNPNCQNGVEDLDHEVLVVGYGTDDGQDYWLVKNSLSTHWGNEGLIKMARNRGNNCGIATQANYALV